MDDVAVIATPSAIAAVAPELAKRLLADGATLEQTKCVWTTLGGEKVRAQFPDYAKVGCLEINGEPVSACGGVQVLDKQGNGMVDHAGKPVMGGFGSDFDGIPVGDQEHGRGILQAWKR